MYCPLPAETLLIISYAASNLTRKTLGSPSKCKYFIDTIGYLTYQVTLFWLFLPTCYSFHNTRNYYFSSVHFRTFLHSSIQSFQHVFYRAPLGKCLFYLQAAEFQTPDTVKRYFTVGLQVFYTRRRSSN